MHTGKEPEAHCVQKGRLGGDSDAPKVRGARSDSKSVVKVNRRKTNRRKTTPLLYIGECQRNMVNIAKHRKMYTNGWIHLDLGGYDS